jgi:hypothetical protein
MPNVLTTHFVARLSDNIILWFGYNAVSTRRKQQDRFDVRLCVIGVQATRIIDDLMMRSMEVWSYDVAIITNSVDPDWYVSKVHALGRAGPVKHSQPRGVYSSSRYAFFV